MRSLTAGLARQIVVAAALSALLIAGVGAQRSDDHRASPASQGADTIFTRAIVTAAASPPPQPTPMAKAPTAPKASAAHPACAPPCAHIVLAQAAHPRPVADPTPEPVNLASIAPTAQTDPPPLSLTKRLFAPVGFIRDNVARLIARL